MVTYATISLGMWQNLYNFIDLKLDHIFSKRGFIARL